MEKALDLVVDMILLLLVMIGFVGVLMLRGTVAERASGIEAAISSVPIGREIGVVC